MEYMQYSNATFEQVSAAAGGLTLEGLHLEAFYEDIDLEALDKNKDRNRRRSTNDKTTNPYAILVWLLMQIYAERTLIINKRRRAQNRASQAAFRARRQQQTQDLEEKLTQLEQKLQDLSQSYESLQLQHSVVKRELETLQRRNSNHEGTSLATTAYHWEGDSKIETSHLYLIDSGEFYFCQDQWEAKRTGELLTSANSTTACLCESEGLVSSAIFGIDDIGWRFSKRQSLWLYL